MVRCSELEKGFITSRLEHFVYSVIRALKSNIQISIEMSQTQNQSKYYYSPRFRHFNIYRRDPDGDTKVDDAATQEEAKRKVYELNGWN